MRILTERYNNKSYFLFQMYSYVMMMNLKEGELLTYFTWFHPIGKKKMEVLIQKIFLKHVN